MPPQPDPDPHETARPPLSGIKVVEVGAYMAAPFATMQLADLGADVVKIENPDGGDAVRDIGPFIDGRSSPFLRLNRNKRSVAIDLKAPDGVAVLRRLLDDADVLVQNLRPGAMDRLGLGYGNLAESHPALIYASASGWGEDGPLAHLPGLDIMAQARSGLMSITGMPDGDPVKLGVPMCDLTCGLYVAMGVLAALEARRTTGRGQHVDVSLFESGVSFTIWEASKYWATGAVGRPNGSAHQSTAPYQALRTSDGWITAGAVSPKTWQGLCTALDLPDLLADPRYADAHDRHGLRHELIPAIESVTLRRTTDDLIAALDAAGVPCAPINTTDQTYNDAHLAQRGFFWEAEHPEVGPIRQIGSPMRLSATPVRRGPAGPELGTDTGPLLEEAGFTPAEIADLTARGIVGSSASAPPAAGS
ncbi:CaiB/BaiF CoA transferase family protein [Nocardiopsis sediminis]|uniref:CaiB/BaiF CoA transferase family protein n=1 Tax=Nocardiopsis sediminis TaxID=1778267 RepID=A0ABV8FTZ1_9ACTN